MFRSRLPNQAVRGDRFVDQRMGDPASRGRPRLADPEQGQRIVQRLAEMSRRYGTVIEWQPDRGVGVVRVPSAS